MPVALRIGFMGMEQDEIRWKDARFAETSHGIV
jgi:hypothetical protein